MVAQTAYDFENYVSTRRALVESYLDQSLALQEPKVLFESMRYSLLSGGKRIRALLCFASAEAVGSLNKSNQLLDIQAKVLPLAAAIEMVHAMSLIHDDLPIMDNDDFRRGKPTNHKVYGEPMALLAGDALLMLAIETLIENSPKEIDKTALLKVTSQLSRATGAYGMVAGQVIDLSMTGKTSAASKENDAKILREMHKLKTGALLCFSVWSGACLAGATPEQIAALKRFGEVIGLAFQIADDLLDVTGNIDSLGKTPGKDQASGKVTWVSMYGMDESKKYLAELQSEAISILNTINLDSHSTRPILDILQYVIHRQN